MANKNRDYAPIKAGLNKMSSTISETRTNGQRLMTETESAEATLRDHVAKKDIDQLKEMATTIMKVAQEGEERIRERLHEIEREEREFEELDR